MINDKLIVSFIIPQILTGLSEDNIKPDAVYYPAFVIDMRVP